MNYRIAYLFAAALVLGAQFTPWVPAAQAQADPFDTARYYLTAKQNAEAIELIDSGQFPIDQTNYEGWTLLHYAAEANNLEMVKELLKRGADPMAKTKYGTRPYDAASGTLVKATLAKAMEAKTGLNPMAPPRDTAPNVAPRPAATGTSTTQTATAQSPRAKMCQARWYSSQALCSDSTCKMREYRKWQTCLKTGSYY